MKGCGCKICKNDLGEFTNDLILGGDTPQDVKDKLLSEGLEVSVKVVKAHLTAYEIPYQDKLQAIELEGVEPVTIQLNQIDFSQYDFDINSPDSIISYLQKLNLKLYLNQARIALQRQQDIIDGKVADMPSDVIKSLESLHRILEKSTGIDVMINQQKAIKAVESLGLIVQKPAYFLPQNNVQNSTEPKAD